MTNIERIREMTDDELACEICGLMKDCGSCPGNDFCVAGDGVANGIRKWLKIEAEDG